MRSRRGTIYKKKCAYANEKCVLDKWFSLVLSFKYIIAENAAIVFEVN